MKTTRLTLSAMILAGAVLAQAQESTATPAAPASTPAGKETTIVSKIEKSSSEEPVKLSSETWGLVTSGFKYNPNQPEPKPKMQPNTADPEVLELEKMTVTNQRVRPRLTPQAMMSRTAFNDQLAKERLSPFDRHLNKYTLPLFGVSAAERARDEYDREKNSELRSDVLSLAKTVEVDNPEQAAELRRQANK